MAESPHYKELLRNLNDCSVEFLVVGGYAVMKYSEPRFTKDLDLWTRPSLENSRRVYTALARFGAPLSNDGVLADTFAEGPLVYQIGIAPARVDIVNHIDGIDFEQAWPNRVESKLFGEPVNFISLEDLIINKRATGRGSDLEHLRDLLNRTGDK